MLLAYGDLVTFAHDTLRALSGTGLLSKYTSNVSTISFTKIGVLAALTLALFSTSFYRPTNSQHLEHKENG